MIRLVLASQSPARLATLRAAGITPIVRVSQIDENAVLAGLPGGRAFDGGPTMPADEVAALAAAKCRAVAASAETLEPDADHVPDADRLVVLGCDSMLEMGQRMLGKPHNPDVARRRIREMRNRSAVLWTGHHAIVLDRTVGRQSLSGLPDSPSGRMHATTRDDRLGAPRWHRTAEAGSTASTVVHFGDISDAEIDAYVDSGEPLEVAGSFTVDGLGGPFITGIEGDYHSVVGLSLPLVRIMLRDLGIFWPDLWDLRR